MTPVEANIVAGRRRRERAAELETLVSSSIDSQTELPRPAQRRPVDRRAQIGHGAQETTPGSSGSSGCTPETPPDLSWVVQSDPQWATLSLNGDTDFALCDTSWAGTDLEFPDLNDFLQSDEVFNASFADDFHISVPELDLLRAVHQIARRLNCANVLFDHQAQSIFINQSSSGSSWALTLPKAFQPTQAQLTISHHALLDILPWPAVRSRLISMYSLPSDLWPRHPSDGAECSLMRLVYDMEDGGVKVTGSDPLSDMSWEVEQKFFEAWWWALDQGVLTATNVKRVARGQPKLTAPMSSKRL